MLSLAHLKTFVTVCHAGSFTKAADLLGQTPSHISRKIAALELDLQVSLFHRTTRQLHITAEGKLVLEKATRLFAITEEIESLGELSGETQLTGQLTIDAAEPFIQHVITPHLAEFAQLHPNLHIVLCSFNRVVDLLEHQIDVAFRIGELKDSSLYYRTLGQTQLQILASPQYLKKYGEPLTVNSLSEHTLIGFTQPKHLNRWPLTVPNNTEATNKAQEALFEADVTIRAQSGEAIRSLVLNHVGIACLADFMTAKDIQAGRLVPLFKSSTHQQYQSVHAVYPKPLASSSKVARFVDFIEEKVRGEIGLKVISDSILTD